jgi:hypothetical protein
MAMTRIRASGIEPGQRRLNGPQTTGRDYRNVSQPTHNATESVLPLGCACASEARPHDKDGNFDPAWKQEVGALIFDFDGVIADSEAIANTVLAEVVTDLGHPTTLDQALTRYSGRRWDEVVAEIEAAIGKPLPADFSGELKRATLDRFVCVGEITSDGTGVR